MRELDLNLLSTRSLLDLNSSNTANRVLIGVDWAGPCERTAVLYDPNVVILAGGEPGDPSLEGPIRHSFGFDARDDPRTNDVDPLDWTLTHDANTQGLKLAVAFAIRNENGTSNCKAAIS